MNLFQANISALEMTDNQIRMFHVSFCDVGISKSFSTSTNFELIVPDDASDEGICLLVRSSTDACIRLNAARLVYHQALVHAGTRAVHR